MKNILVFGASNSQNSINKQMALYTASQLSGFAVTSIDLNDFEMPIFSVDREREGGIPEKARDFKKYIKGADGIVISFAEHNGSYSSAFKNIFDWASRVEKSAWLDRPMFLLATSPGARGGQSVLRLAVNDFPHRGGNVVASFSLPSFSQNFSPDDGIVDNELKKQFNEQLHLFIDNL